MATAAEKAAAKAAEEQAAAKAAEEQAASEKAAADQVAVAEQATAEIKANAAQALESPKEDAGERFEAVCLRDCEFGSVGEVVEISEQEINAGRLSGSIDNHPDAIAYAKSIKE